MVRAAMMRMPANVTPIPAAAAGAREVLEDDGDGIEVAVAEVVAKVGAGVDEDGTAESG